MKKIGIIISVVLLLALILIASMVIKMKNSEARLEELVSMELEDIQLAGMADGAYKGSHSVFPIDVEVIVNVKDEVIEAISIEKHVNGKGKAAERIVENVILEQSLNVDVISGATYSSKVILKAIEKAVSLE